MSTNNSRSHITQSFINEQKVVQSAANKALETMKQGKAAAQNAQNAISQRKASSASNVSQPRKGRNPVTASNLRSKTR